jgi:hypothetical protein
MPQPLQTGAPGYIDLPANGLFNNFVPILKWIASTTLELKVGALANMPLRHIIMVLLESG